MPALPEGVLRYQLVSQNTQEDMARVLVDTLGSQAEWINGKQLLGARAQADGAIWRRSLPLRAFVAAGTLGSTLRDRRHTGR